MTPPSTMNERMRSRLSPRMYCAVSGCTPAAIMAFTLVCSVTGALACASGRSRSQAAPSGAASSRASRAGGDDSNTRCARGARRSAQRRVAALARILCPGVVERQHATELCCSPPPVGRASNMLGAAGRSTGSGESTRRGPLRRHRRRSRRGARFPRPSAPLRRCVAARGAARRASRCGSGGP